MEKDDQESLVLQALEGGAHSVVRGNWRNVIDSEVAQDLRKYRNYRGTSVRDLLRALRNKVSKVFLLMMLWGVGKSTLIFPHDGTHCSKE